MDAMQLFRPISILAVTSLFGVAPATAATQSRAIPLKPMYGSGVHGTAVLTQRGADIVFTANISMHVVCGGPIHYI